jgi:hypothetical protein
MKTPKNRNHKIEFVPQNAKNQKKKIRKFFSPVLQSSRDQGRPRGAERIGGGIRPTNRRPARLAS